MFTSRNEWVASPRRTIAAGAWSKATHTTPTLPGEVSTAVGSIMDELSQKEVGPLMGSRSPTPWLPIGEACSGVVWASVPRLREFYRDVDGGWVIDCRVHDSDLSPRDYLRLSPAAEGEDRVQFGFCPIRVNKMSEMTQETWGTDKPVLTAMTIQAGHSSSFRSDKMAISAIRLAHPTVSTPESDRFQGLLGRRSISVFIEDLLRGCYMDSSSRQSILQNRDETYRALVELVANHAYGSWSTPTTDEELARFRCATGTSTQDRWSSCRVWPYMYNVVMPRAIFEANSRNLEAGIPPIVPHYMTSEHWMFNGPWNDPCAGLSFSGDCGVSVRGRKLVGGMLGTSNLDLTGKVSLWPVRDNPPQEWIDGFVRCINRVADMEMPLDTEDKSDLVLHESHRIPLVFRVHEGNPISRAGTHKFVRMIDRQVDQETHLLSGIVVQECSPSGEEWVGEQVRTGSCLNQNTVVVVNEEDHIECVECDDRYHVDDRYTCRGCGEQVCINCADLCDGCGTYNCQACTSDLNEERTICNACHTDDDGGDS